MVSYIKSFSVGATLGECKLHCLLYVDISLLAKSEDDLKTCLTYFINCYRFENHLFFWLKILVHFRASSLAIKTGLVFKCGFEKKISLSWWEAMFKGGNRAKSKTVACFESRLDKLWNGSDVMYDQLRQETKNQNIRRSAQPGTDVDYDLTTEALRPISQKRTMKTGLVFKCGYEKK